MSRAKLRIAGLLCLLTTALLALAVAHNSAPFGFEEPAFDWLAPRSARETWTQIADLLAAPAIGVAVVLSIAVGAVRRAFLRVVVYAAFAAAALLISEEIAKPLVHRTLDGQLTFPSGHVTAVSATALAMWLALYPLLGKRARNITLVLGVAWTLLISLAVVGAHWHAPLDAVGSVLLAVGIVATGAAVFEPALTRAPFMGAGRAPIGESGAR